MVRTYGPHYVNDNAVIRGSRMTYGHRRISCSQKSAGGFDRLALLTKTVSMETLTMMGLTRAPPLSQHSAPVTTRETLAYALALKTAVLHSTTFSNG